MHRWLYCSQVNQSRWHTGEIWENRVRDWVANKDRGMMKMAMKRKTLSGVFDIRLSQLTCKILETGTNANSADLLAPKKSSRLYKWTHPHNGGVPRAGWIYGLGSEWHNVWEPNRELWSEGSGPSRLPATVELSLGCYKADHHHYSPPLGRAWRTLHCRPEFRMKNCEA